MRGVRVWEIFSSEGAATRQKEMDEGEALLAEPGALFPPWCGGTFPGSPVALGELCEWEAKEGLCTAVVL